MNQEKIGAFIAEKRKENELTQEQLADKLNVSKNAVSKWERGLNLPDVSIMQDLCKILDITLNELFAGEKILDEKYKEVADNNLLNALENSSFTLKERVDYYKRKWRKDHISKIILCSICWITLIIILKLQNVQEYVIGAVAGLLSVLFYTILYNQMMIYVEKNAYGNKYKVSIDDYKTYMQRLKELKALISKFDTQDEAIEYLIKESGLSKKECKSAYDIVSRIDFDKIDLM